MIRIRRFDFLVALYVFCILISELMGGKTFTMFSWQGFQLHTTVAIFVLPLLFTINDSIVEVYGKERARSVVWASLIMIALLIPFALLATGLPPSARFTSSEIAYDQVFGVSVRIAIASLAAFIISELMDIAIFARLRKLLGKKSLWLRNNISNIISQFFDTLVFMAIAFYAFNETFGSNLAFLAGLIIPYWLIRCLVSAFETPLVYLGVKWLRSGKNDES